MHVFLVFFINAHLTGRGKQEDLKSSLILK